MGAHRDDTSCQSAHGKQSVLARSSHGVWMLDTHSVSARVASDPAYLNCGQSPWSHVRPGQVGLSLHMLQSPAGYACGRGLDSRAASLSGSRAKARPAACARSASRLTSLAVSEARVSFLKRRADELGWMRPAAAESVRSAASWAARTAKRRVERMIVIPAERRKNENENEARPRPPPRVARVTATRKTFVAASPQFGAGWAPRARWPGRAAPRGAPRMPSRPRVAARPRPPRPPAP